MKKKLLFLSMVLAVFTANAQYTVADRGGNPINDGDVREYGDFEKLDFFVTNTGSETIYTRIEVVNITNTDGVDFELCYGECYVGITVGMFAPESPLLVTLAPGEVSLDGNHFYNYDPGNGTDVLEYVFAFHQYESTGTTEIGTPLTFTYRYNPTLGVSDISKLDFSIQSTIVSRELVVNAKEALQMDMYNLQGKLVKQANLEVGRQTINTADLSSQVYILQFSNGKGLSQTAKIVVQ